METPQPTPSPTAPARSGPAVTGTTRQVVIALDRAIFVFSKHWLLAFNVFFTLYVGLPFLAPVCMWAGWEAAARVIYTLYSPLCNQFAPHAWFLFGARSFYPAAVFQAYTGIDSNTAAGLAAARAFVGNAALGYKVAICERDVAIYAMMLLGGLLFSLPPVRRHAGPLRWWAWLLIGIVPIGVDGFWQMFTTYPFTTLFHFLSWLPYHESTPLDRTLTGGLFGLANMWLAYPYFETSMREVQVEVKVKLARVGAAKLKPVA